MSLIIPANTLASGGFAVDNSLRFNSGSSDYLTRTPSSATNKDLWSLSFWIKRSNLGSYQSIYGVYANSTNQETLAFDDSDRLYWQLYQSSAVKGQLTTNRVFRDVSAFYNILIVYDSANGTAGNRMRMYINGVEETSFATDTNPSSGQDSQWNSTTAHTIGRINTTNYTNGYISELVAVDGTALSPTDVGEFDEDSGIWKPIDVSGLTFGTNGFYLDFENSGALGADVSGNTNNFTVNNLTAIDQTTDTPTLNFCTMNALDNFYQAATFSEGNCKYTTASSAYTYGTSTIGVSSGKWYTEVKITDGAGIEGDTHNTIGIVDTLTTAATGSGTNIIGNGANQWGWHNDQQYTHNGSTTGSFGDSWHTGDILGQYVDLDNNKLYWSKNGTLQNTTGFALNGSVTFFFAVGDRHSGDTGTYDINFGNPTYAISSGNTDDNGYGNFEYSPNITGDSVAKKFYALNTKNLSEFG